MSWFYATENKEQVGPIDLTTLEGLFRSGTVSEETLVWKEGMVSWRPYAMVFAPPEKVSLAPTDGQTRCAECGEAFEANQLIILGSRPVCAACKPRAIQKFQEGVTTFGSPGDPEEIWRRVQERGFDFTISSVLGRSWAVVKGNFWPCVGVTLLGYLILMGSGQIPFAGILAVFFVQSQILAGLQWYFLRQFRGEGATLNDSFAGFRRGYWQQALYMLILYAVIMAMVIVCAIPIVILIALASRHHQTSPMEWFPFLLLIPVVLASWYLFISWIFTPLLILDKGLKATAAMTLSRRVVKMHFWKITGLCFVAGLITLGGLIALLVGVLVALPVLFGTFARLYEDAFGEERPETTA